MYSLFQPVPDTEPFAVVTPRVSVTEINAPTAFGAQASMKMNLEEADMAPEIELNEIIWRSVRGADSPMPPPKSARRSSQSGNGRGNANARARRSGDANAHANGEGSRPARSRRTPLRIGSDQPDAEAVPDVESFEASIELALDGWAIEAHPGAFVGRAGHHRRELLADAIAEPQRRRGLADPALHLVGRILLLRAVLREGRELGQRIRGRVAVGSGLDQPLRDQIREAPVRRGRVRVVGFGQREVDAPSTTGRDSRRRTRRGRAA